MVDKVMAVAVVFILEGEPMVYSGEMVEGIVTVELMVVVVIAFFFPTF